VLTQISNTLGSEKYLVGPDAPNCNSLGAVEFVVNAVYYSHFHATERR